MSEQESPQAESPAASPAPKKSGSMIRNLIFAALVIAGLVYGVQMYQFNQTHVTTDDAYVTNDIIPISPEENGRVAEVAVKLNSRVRAGDILVRMVSDDFETNLMQSRATLAVAEASASSGTASVDLTKVTGDAQAAQAHAGVGQAMSDVESARLSALQANGGVSAAESSEAVAQGQYSAALDAVRLRQADIRRAQEQLNAAKAQVTSAQAALRSAQASIASYQAASSFAENERVRYESLLEAGAVSVSAVESRRSEAERAKSALVAGEAAVTSAKSQLAVRESELAAAKVAVEQAQLAVKQANSQALVLARSIDEQRARTSQTRAAERVALAAIRAAQSRVAQAQGKLAESNTVAQKTLISDSARRTANAKVEEAKANLARAELALRRTILRAPVTGTISKKNVEIGQQVTTGQPLLALIPDQLPWVIANFKETQMGRIQVGLEAEVEVDALSGRRFKGHVDSISGGTGSVFALLPADNATGNFTKIVQRVPVKIVLEPGQEGLDLLRAGLSTTVILRTK